ncbi:MAG: D-alanyl-D-alanine carboxypeptidase [Ruminococcaceae bacterium]|nr:D-alanyl-D-alanine carboxypeptidase [Oscillospiraceae bacterium]
MKHWILLILFLIFMMPVRAEELPEVSAKSAIVLEYTGGTVVYAKNAEERLPMASTTKIMTALVALEKGVLSDTVTVGANAAGVEGSSMYLRQGEKLTLEELLYGLMLTSGNDAAVAISEHIAGSEAAFAEMMTARAVELGCTNTRFKNANGLPDEEHYTTALELARITGKALENETFRKIVSSQSVRIGNRTLSNHNKLLSLYEGAIGVKTGFTKAAGRTLVSAAERGGITLIAVTLNAPDDWDDHAKMLDYGFSCMEKRCVTEKGGYAGTLRVEGGTEDSVELCFGETFSLSVLKTAETEVKINLPSGVQAPVSAGTVLGTGEIFANNVKMGEVPLLASAAVEEQYIPTFRDYLQLVFSRWVTMYIK